MCMASYTVLVDLGTGKAAWASGLHYDNRIACGHLSPLTPSADPSSAIEFADWKQAVIYATFLGWRAWTVNDRQEQIGESGWHYESAIVEDPADE